MKKTKLLVPILAGVMLLVISNRPAHAITGIFKDFLNSTLDLTVGTFTSEFQGRMQPHIDKAVSDTLGALGIPDIDEARQNIESDVDAEGNAIFRNPEVEKNLRSEDLENTVGSSIAETTLGAEGQEASKQNSEADASALDSVAKAAQASSKVPITQHKIDKQNEILTHTAGMIGRQGAKLDTSNRNTAATLRAVTRVNKRNTRIDLAEEEGGIGESNKYLLDEAASSGMWESFGQ